MNMFSFSFSLNKRLICYDIEAACQPSDDFSGYFEHGTKTQHAVGNDQKKKDGDIEELNELYTAGLCSREYLKHKLKDSSTFMK
jgi:hypothetical protein